MTDLVKPKSRTIVIRYRDPQGRPSTTTREVHFLRGYGHYIRWNKRMVLIDDPFAVIMELPAEGRA